MHDLSADGIYGPKTREKIEALILNKKALFSRGLFYNINPQYFRLPV